MEQTLKKALFIILPNLTYFERRKPAFHTRTPGTFLNSNLFHICITEININNGRRWSSQYTVMNFRFNVNLQANDQTFEQCDVLFHMSFHLDENTVVENAFQVKGKKWMREERVINLNICDKFKVLIVCENTEFKVASRRGWTSPES